jgi:glycosyltransferase involved in cell wall biosynthesis
VKALFNGTTLNIGGGLQAALNFIESALSDSSLDWQFAISSQVSAELGRVIDLGIHGDRFHLFHASPARSLGARRRLKQLEGSIDPAFVMTLFGPAYVRFTSPHFLGAVDAWITNPNRYVAALRVGPVLRSRLIVECAYKGRWLKRADQWFVESDIVKQGLMSIVKCRESDVLVVPNGCREVFQHLEPRTSQMAHDEVVRLLFISAYYPHKNFEIVPRVAQELRRLLPNRQVEFVLTIDPAHPRVQRIADEARALGVERSVSLIGAVPVQAVADVYRRVHIAFIPTLLESYSAAYSEAMTCGLPIVTSDLDFARSICGDAARYFEPDNAHDAAVQCAAIITDHELRASLICSGKQQASRLPSSSEKYLLYKNFMLARADAGTPEIPLTEE